MTQRRWVCRTCRREWVYAHGGSDVCPSPDCGSAAIEQVQFAGLFDRETPAMGAIAEIPPPATRHENEVVEPPMTLTLSAPSRRDANGIPEFR